ncbi:MAG: YafY family transcriptional regulator [Treponema sp.]|nr:YafY family transcriptional regulator [Treponema sp.]
MKFDRLLGILTVLLQHERVTAPQLAKKFEVSRRTIGRDIDALCVAGIPVITHQGIGGGITIAEGFKFDKTVFTSDELAGIIAALKGIGSVSNQPQIERTLDKLGANKAASNPAPMLIDLAADHKEQLTEKIETIKKAILNRRVIEFDYYYEKGEARRRIEPDTVLYYWSSWYVSGFCLARQGWRLFKLTRLWNLKLSGDTYTPREMPEEPEEQEGGAQRLIKLAALFDKSVKYKLIETYGMDSFSESPNGLHFEMDFSDRQFLIRWLLGFGDKVRVLKPKAIVDDIKSAARKILSNYE